MTTTDQQIKYQDLKNLLDPQFILFGHEFNPNIKLQHRVEVINKQIVIHQDQVSTKRFNQIMKMVQDNSHQQEQDEALQDRQWENQYLREQQYDNDEEQDGWVTQEQQQQYLDGGAFNSPMKNLGVMTNMQSQTQSPKKQRQIHE